MNVVIGTLFVLLLLALGVVAHLFVKYNSVVAHSAERARQQYEVWRDSELSAVRTQLSQAAHTEAEALIQAARAEADALVSTAHAEADLAASQRAQEQLESWRERELATMRAEVVATARAEAHTELERWRLDSEQGIREDAIRRSASVVSGKVTEHLAPYMSHFPYNPKDVRFLGSPIDLIVFDGLSDGSVGRVVFVEIKSGTASLSSRERSVRDAVMEKQVDWEEFRVAGGRQNAEEVSAVGRRPVLRRRRRRAGQVDDMAPGGDYPRFRDRMPPVKDAPRGVSVYVFCPKCGEPVPPGAAHCGSCGARSEPNPTGDEPKT